LRDGGGGHGGHVYRGGDAGAMPAARSGQD